MPDTLLQLLLARLSEAAAPLVFHREIAALPSQETAAFLSAGILRETSKATEIPRPSNMPPGDDLIVRQTSHGLFGVAPEDDYFAPVTLTEDDIRQYEIVVSKFVERIRRANRLQGEQHQEGRRLFSLGQRRQADGSKAEVYLSLLNRDEADVCDVARQLQAVQRTPTVLLLPMPISISVTVRQALTEMQTFVFALSDSLAPDKWTLPWEEQVIAGTDKRRMLRTGIGWEEANKRVQEYLANHAKKHGIQLRGQGAETPGNLAKLTQFLVKIRALAKAVGCSQALISSKCPAWADYQKLLKGPGQPKAVGLTDKTLSGRDTATEDPDRDAEVDAAMKKEAGLDELVAESNKDNELDPSPLAENVKRRRFSPRRRL